MKTGSLRQVRERTLRGDSLPDDVEPIDPRTPAVRANQPGEHFHGRALARAVGADQQRDLAALPRRR